MIQHSNGEQNPTTQESSTQESGCRKTLTGKTLTGDGVTGGDAIFQFAGRRVVRVLATQTFFTNLMTTGFTVGGRFMNVTCVAGLPAGAVCVCVLKEEHPGPLPEHSKHEYYVFVYEHRSFAVVPQGDVPPELGIAFCQKTYDPHAKAGELTTAFDGETAKTEAPLETAASGTVPQTE